MSGVYDTGNGTPNPHVAINHDYINSEKNNYTTRPSTFTGDSTEFEWWKRKMYTHIISLDDELWDIIEYGINITINGVGMLSDRKTLTLAQEKTYIKHHRVRDILVDVLPHS